MKRIILPPCLFALTVVSAYAQGGWVTDSKTECKVWDPAPDPSQSITWSGKCENGIANGEGVVTWYGKNNEILTTLKGVLQEGRCQGECLMNIGNGANAFRYTGEMEDNERDGFGVFIWPIMEPLL